MNPENWEYWGYIVAAPRQDGTAPSFEKALDSKIYLSFDEAEQFRTKISKDVGYQYEIFPVCTMIPRGKPAYKELYGETT